MSRGSFHFSSVLVSDLAFFFARTLAHRRALANFSRVAADIFFFVFPPALIPPANVGLLCFAAKRERTSQSFENLSH
jgi:hypothetical protein